MRKTMCLVVLPGVLLALMWSIVDYSYDDSKEEGVGKQQFFYNENILVLNTTLPTDTPQLQRIVYQDVRIDKESAEEVLEKHFPEFKWDLCGEVHLTDERTAYRFTNRSTGSYIVVGPYFIKYHNNQTMRYYDDYNLTSHGISFSEMERIAIEYLEGHNLMPKDRDVVLKTGRGMVIRDGKEILVERIFTYRKTINGKESYGGQKIRIRVSVYGEVLSLFYYWPDKVAEMRSIKVISAKEAYETLVNNTSHLPGLISGRVMEITSVCLKYYTSGYREEAVYTEPRWVFYINGDEGLYLEVSALDGRLPYLCNG
ncbi:MAG: hypothetical protein J7L88_04665 [Thermoplasmata archaeon]|nr:hypothetical protein [Thermoplasmata archaeon]